MKEVQISLLSTFLMLVCYVQAFPHLSILFNIIHCYRVNNLHITFSFKGMKHVLRHSLNVDLLIILIFVKIITAFSPFSSFLYVLACLFINLFDTLIVSPIANHMVVVIVDTYPVLKTSVSFNPHVLRE